MNDEALNLEDAFDELSSAEDFLQYFDIPYDAPVVHVNRLHIMQRFHDYLEQSSAVNQEYESNEEALKTTYRALLQQAYQDFVDSDARTEKVFKVFKTQGAQTGFVSAQSLLES